MRYTEKIVDSIENVSLTVPSMDDLWFRESMLADEDTMSYNHAWGGTIPFPKDRWDDWYDYWVVNNENERFYAFMVDSDTREFIGEIAYHLDRSVGRYMANVIVMSEFRGKGYGRIGLELLCRVAKRNGVKVLYDDIAIDNGAIKLFLNSGFVEEYRTDEIIMLKKEL